jgi:hypothetical protein
MTALRAGPVLALAAVFALAFTGGAGAKKVTKTTTFTTHSTLVGFGLSPLAPVGLVPLKTFVNGARIKSLRVKVRLDHPNVGEVDLYLLDNIGRVIELSTGNGAGGTGFGSGPNDCSGTPTVFEDAAPTAITAGTPPYAGSFQPEKGPIAAAGELTGVYWLVAADSTPSAGLGTIGCWQLEFTYVKKVKKHV